MSDRIRQLEDGLAILQSSVTREPHPLLAGDFLNIKSGLELHSASELGASELQRERSGGEGPTREDEEEESTYIDAFGTLAVRDDGAATFYGRSAGSEVRCAHSSFVIFVTKVVCPYPSVFSTPRVYYL